MGCGASSDRRAAAAASRYGVDGVGKVGLSGAEATEAKKAIRAVRLFESVSEQVLTDIVSNKCARPPYRPRPPDSRQRYCAAHPLSQPTALSTSRVSPG